MKRLTCLRGDGVIEADDGEYVRYEDAEREIDAERALRELSELESLSGRKDITKLLEGDENEPRWKWIRIAIMDLKDSLAKEATRAEVFAVLLNKCKSYVSPRLYEEVMDKLEELK